MHPHKHQVIRRIGPIAKDATTFCLVTYSGREIFEIAYFQSLLSIILDVDEEQNNIFNHVVAQ